MNEELLGIQRMFQDRLLSGAHDIKEHLINEGPFLKVYDHAYVARLLSVMGEDFPAVHALQGDEEFAEAACAYINAQPSTERSIRWLGRNFPTWLRETEPWQNLPVLSDMAEFEWALGLAFDAPDSEPLGFETLAAVPPEAWPSLKFDFHPSLKTISLNFNVVPFHQAIANDLDPESAPEQLSIPETWVFWRDADSLKVYFRSLSTEESAGLFRLQNKEEFSILCEVIAETGGQVDASLRAAEYIRNWVECGWITGIMAEGYSWSLGQMKQA